MSGRQRIIVSQMLKFLKKEEDFYVRNIKMIEQELLRLEIEGMKLKSSIREEDSWNHDEDTVVKSHCVNRSRSVSLSDSVSGEGNSALSPVRFLARHLIQKNTNNDDISNEDKMPVTNCPGSSTDIQDYTVIEEMSLDAYLLREESKEQDKEDEIAAFLSSSLNENGSFSPCLNVERNSESSSMKLTPKHLKKQETDIDASNGIKREEIQNSGNCTDLQNCTMAESVEPSRDDDRYLEPLILNPSYLEDDAVETEMED